MRSPRARTHGAAYPYSAAPWASCSISDATLTRVCVGEWGWDGVEQSYVFVSLCRWASALILPPLLSPVFITINPNASMSSLLARVTGLGINTHLEIPIATLPTTARRMARNAERPWDLAIFHRLFHQVIWRYLFGIDTELAQHIPHRDLGHRVCMYACDGIMPVGRGRERHTRAAPAPPGRKSNMVHPRRECTC